MTMDLKYPIKVEGHETVSKLTFRRLRAKDMRALRAFSDELDRGLMTLSLLTDLPIEVIDEMDADDMNRALEEMADFLPETDSSPSTSGPGG